MTLKKTMNRVFVTLSGDLAVWAVWRQKWQVWVWKGQQRVKLGKCRNWLLGVFLCPLQNYQRWMPVFQQRDGSGVVEMLLAQYVFSFRNNPQLHAEYPKIANHHILPNMFLCFEMTLLEVHRRFTESAKKRKAEIIREFDPSKVKSRRTWIC